MSSKKALAVVLAVFFLLFLLNSLVMARPSPEKELHYHWGDSVWAPDGWGHPWGDQNVFAPQSDNWEHPEQKLRRPNDDGHPWGDQLPEGGV